MTVLLYILLTIHVLGHDTMIDGLQNSIRQLNKLYKSVQVVREYDANVIKMVRYLTHMHTLHNYLAIYLHSGATIIFGTVKIR